MTYTHKLHVLSPVLALLLSACVGGTDEIGNGQESIGTGTVTGVLVIQERTESLAITQFDGPFAPMWRAAADELEPVADVILLDAKDNPFSAEGKCVGTVPASGAWQLDCEAGEYWVCFDVYDSSHKADGMPDVCSTAAMVTDATTSVGVIHSSGPKSPLQQNCVVSVANSPIVRGSCSAAPQLDIRVACSLAAPVVLQAHNLHSDAAPVTLWQAVLQQNQISYTVPPNWSATNSPEGAAWRLSMYVADTTEPEIASDTFVLLDRECNDSPTAVLILNDGAAYSTSTQLTVSIPAHPAPKTMLLADAGNAVAYQPQFVWPATAEGTVELCADLVWADRSTRRVCDSIYVDSTPPDTRIITGPYVSTTFPDAAFTFTGTDSGSGVAGYMCRLDSGAWFVCNSGYATTVTYGEHNFYVRAYDRVGLLDPSPAVYTWTYSQFEQPMEEVQFERVWMLYSGGCALSDRQELYCWGVNGGPLNYRYKKDDQYYPTPRLVLSGVDIVQVVEGNTLCYLTTVGTAYCKGLAYALGNGGTLWVDHSDLGPWVNEFQQVVTDSPYVMLGAHGQIGLREDGVVSRWGRVAAFDGEVAEPYQWYTRTMTNGIELSDPRLTYTNEFDIGYNREYWYAPSPVNLILPFNVVDINDYGASWCILDDQHRLYCWGHNQYGSLGIGVTSTTYYSTPQQVTQPAEWQSIPRSRVATTTGNNHCGITLAGELYCWGGNLYGQLGQGNTNAFGDCQFSSGQQTCSAHPVRVGSDSDWSRVWIGGRSCAQKTDGTVWCWGTYPVDEFNVQILPPTQISTAPWAEFAHNDNSACGIRVGELYCMWDNWQYALGTGDTAYRSEPTRIHAYRPIPTERR